MQIKIIKRESKEEYKKMAKARGKLKTKIYSNNTNEYFVYSLTEREEHGRESRKFFSSLFSSFPFGDYELWKLETHFYCYL